MPGPRFRSGEWWVRIDGPVAGAGRQTRAELEVLITRYQDIDDVHLIPWLSDSEVVGRRTRERP